MAPNTLDDVYDGSESTESDDSVFDAVSHDTAKYEQPWRDPAVLDTLYHGKDLTQSEMADVLGCDRSTISQWMHRHRVAQERPWRSEERLRELYVERMLPQSEIADRLGCSTRTVRKWLDEHGIERQKANTLSHVRQALCD